MINSYFVLGQEAHWQVNKRFAQKFGINSALFIGDLLSKRQFLLTNNHLSSPEEWFFCTVENVEEYTTLTKHEQQRCVEILSEAGILQLKYEGMPRRRHIRIKDSNLIDLLVAS